MSKKEIDIGEHVYCDSCNEDYYGRDDQGGILFGSKAYCPTCAKRILPDIIAYHEERFVLAVCPDGMSYWRWVLSLRNGNNKVTVYTGKDLEDIREQLKKGANAE